MRRFWILSTLAVIGLVTFNTLSVVYAYPPCGAYQPQTDANGGSFCRPMFLGNELARINDALAFAWIRTYPNSQSEAIVATVLPSRTATLVLSIDQWGNTTEWDGHQWWWHVRLYPASAGSPNGWIEQASLVTLPNLVPETYPPDMLAPWQTPVYAGVKPGIPFVWLREQPNSGAGIIVTVLNKQSFTVQSDTAPQFDGMQWWWMVEHQSGATLWRGWVEQSSIRIIR
jgi:hypothetical protein